MMTVYENFQKLNTDSLECTVNYARELIAQEYAALEQFAENVRTVEDILHKLSCLAGADGGEYVDGENVWVHSATFRNKAMHDRCLSDENFDPAFSAEDPEWREDSRYQAIAWCNVKQRILSYHEWDKPLNDCSAATRKKILQEVGNKGLNALLLEESKALVKHLGE